MILLFKEGYNYVLNYLIRIFLYILLGKWEICFGCK